MEVVVKDNWRCWGEDGGEFAVVAVVVKVAVKVGTNKLREVP